MIYTSYFGNLKQILQINKNIVPIAICTRYPYWYKGIYYKKLAPKYNILNKWKNDHDVESYTKEYNEQILNKLDASVISKELYGLSNNNDIVLLCYEKTGDFCHRNLVAKWFNDNGILCEEVQILS